jgi:hypothetical protein
MYYPFYPIQQQEQWKYFGTSVKTKNNEYFANYYRKLQSEDISYATYPLLYKDIINFDKKNNQKKENIQSYFQGMLWKKMYRKLHTEYKNIKKFIPSINKKNGRLPLRILYDDTDIISIELFNLYVSNLNQIGYYLISKGEKIQIMPIPVKLRDTKAKDIKDVPNSAFDIAIYGWSYSFDFLSELIQYESSAFKDIRKLTFDINKNELFPTIFAKPYYIIYNSEAMQFTTLNKLNIYLEVYPYYWK